MIKKWLRVLLVMIVLIIGGFFPQSEIVLIVKNTPVQQLQTPGTPQNVNNTLLVNSNQLFAHVQKLNFQRCSTMERIRTRTYQGFINTRYPPQ